MTAYYTTPDILLPVDVDSRFSDVHRNICKAQDLDYAHLELWASKSPPITLPAVHATVVPRRNTCGTRKLAPHSMWNGGREYATQLGNAAGLRVTAVEAIGKNNDFNLPCPGESGGPPALPSFHDLRTMTAQLHVSKKFVGIAITFKKKDE
ncbi:hypothetical protein K505DRAFT_364446 [Melanomma pulvis-pyrius CBS 109.77]|uniref:Uncharacterized protein n=1 Tax=Melanomma pulvis-pyrius CBS 109.77 TaxID=1314802 RepID=A0A6A6X3I7_9PLEO|nr:hypothetical protein K505DRAFT_364446 [Melanomma pulvis-pyrius CBS 109.77]